MKFKKLTEGILNELNKNNESDYLFSDRGIKEIIQIIQNEDKWFLYLENKVWNVNTEWLVGTFAGRVFTSETKEDAIKQMIKYFNGEVGLNTPVGDILRNAGWPNLNSVKQYLIERKNAEDDID